MILSYNAPQIKEDSSEGSIKEENFQEIKAIIKDKKKPEDNTKNNLLQNNISNWEENNLNFSHSDHMSRIEKRNSSVSSSLQGLSRGEDCIQKDVLKEINDDSVKKGIRGLNDSEIFERKSSNEEEKIINVSREMSFHSPKLKNYILKSTLIPSKEQVNGAFSSTNSNSLRQSNEMKYDPSYQTNFSSFINNAKIKNTEDNQGAYTKFQSKTQSTPFNDFYLTQTQNQSLLQQDNYNQIAYQNDVNKLTQQVDSISLSMKHNQMDKQTINDYQSINKSNLTLFNPNNNANTSTTPVALDDSKLQMLKQRRSRYEAPNDTELINNCGHYCKEQAGCRLLQKKLEEYPTLATDVFYPNIKSQIIEFACDPFGNYFIQKIIVCLSLDKLEEFIQKQLPNAFRMMSFSPHGTRVIQKLFERIISNSKLLGYYTKLLKPNIKDFIFDVNACHIIIQYVSLVPSPSNDFLIEYFVENIYELAIQKQSCCALQKCIEYVNEKQKKILYHAVAYCSLKLFSDQYGNYVVQFVIGECDYDVNHVIMVNFLKDFENFCIQKFSSNVIEKCLSYCSDETKTMIVKYLCNPLTVQLLLYNMYGNYVLQKVMSIAKDPYKTMLFEYMIPHLEKLALLSFGPKLLNRLLSSFPELLRFVKNGKMMGMRQKKTQQGNSLQGNIGSNMLPNMIYQPPINSFQNYGNVYYQNNPLYNKYHNRLGSIQQMQPIQPMNNYINPQFYQHQGMAGPTGMYMPMNYSSQMIDFNKGYNYTNATSSSNGFMMDNNASNPFYINGPKDQM